MISLRAHGDSTGEYNDAGFSARRDVWAAVEFLETRCPGRPVIVVGYSKGAATATFAASELAHRVQGYVLESPYQDLKDATWNRTDVYLPPVLSQIAYAGLRIVGPLFLPHLEEISPLKAISGIPDNVPVLIFAGRGDRLARPEEAQALFSKVATHGRLVFVPSSGHDDLSFTTSGVYAQTVLDFCREISARGASLPRSSTPIGSW
jgi:alpha-beta hydrolase superfamily lysophospholipase